MFKSYKKVIKYELRRIILKKNVSNNTTKNKEKLNYLLLLIILLMNILYNYTLLLPNNANIK